MGASSTVNASPSATALRHQPESMPGYTLPRFPYLRPDAIDAHARGEPPPIHPVVVVGGGLVGLTAALDLGRQGIPVVLLDEDDTVGSAGLSSRGICYAQRTLEIFDRLGIAARMLAKGITWTRGRVFRGADEVYAFDLQPERDAKFPAFVNLQQFYVEHMLVDAIAETQGVDLRWRHRVTDVVIGADATGPFVTVTCETPDGAYPVRARWLIAADGGRSFIRRTVGAEDEALGLFEDRWCIADMRMERDAPPVRSFWLDSPHVDGGAVLLHQMADGVWRTDWQIGHYPDSDAEATPARATERLRMLLGPDHPFELVWVGPWRFKTRWLARFVHGPVIFVGDSAHELPPFGARGGNSGVQDADNLCWKLAAVIRGEAPPDLIDSYETERRQAAADNIAIAARTIRFVKPETTGQHLVRNALLDLARHHAWARPAVNTGRLSTPTRYTQSALVADASDPAGFGPMPGEAAPDGALSDGTFLVEHLRGFVALCFGQPCSAVPVPLHDASGRVRTVLVLPPDGALGEAAPAWRDAGATIVQDPTGTLGRRYGVDGQGATFVVRPDGHVLARTRGIEPGFARTVVRRLFAVGEAVT